MTSPAPQSSDERDGNDAGGHKPPQDPSIYSPEYEGWSNHLPYQDYEPAPSPVFETPRKSHDLVSITINGVPHSVPDKFCCVLCARGAFGLQPDQVLLRSGAPHITDEILDIGAPHLEIQQDDAFDIVNLADLTDHPASQARQEQDRDQEDKPFDDDPVCGVEYYPDGSCSQDDHENAAQRLPAGFRGCPASTASSRASGKLSDIDDIEILTRQLLDPIGTHDAAFASSLILTPLDLANRQADLAASEPDASQAGDHPTDAMSLTVRSPDSKWSIRKEWAILADVGVAQPTSFMAYDPIGLDGGKPNMAQILQNPPQACSQVNQPPICPDCETPHWAPSLPNNVRPCQVCHQGLSVLESLVRPVEQDSAYTVDAHQRACTDILALHSSHCEEDSGLTCEEWDFVECWLEDIETNSEGTHYTTIVMYPSRCTNPKCSAYRRPPPDLC